MKKKNREKERKREKKIEISRARRPLARAYLRGTRLSHT